MAAVAAKDSRAGAKAAEARSIGNRISGRFAGASRQATSPDYITRAGEREQRFGAPKARLPSVQAECHASEACPDSLPILWAGSKSSLKNDLFDVGKLQQLVGKKNPDIPAIHKNHTAVPAAYKINSRDLAGSGTPFAEYALAPSALRSERLSTHAGSQRGRMNSVAKDNGFRS
jgi:hypothetical protein